MLGRYQRKLTFADLDGWEQAIPPTSIYAQIRHWMAEHFRDEDFADWYGSTGRPSKPPTVVLALTLLQLREGVSDRDAVDNARFDDRWKFALDLSRSPEITLDHSTLTRYRTRLLDTDFGRTLLRMTLADASAAGLLGAAEDLIDSFMIAGAAARQGTLVLIRQAIRRVLIECETAGLAQAVPTLRRSDYADRKKPALNWASAEARAEFLQDLAADGRTLVAYWPTPTDDASDPVPPSVRQALTLLALVVEQDIEPDPDHPDQVRIAQRVAPDRILSTVDPDLRHGRKTSSQKFDGYKGHITVQNRADGDGAFITGASVTGGNVADGDATVEVLNDRQANTGALPEHLMGDTAYGGIPTRKDVEAEAPSVILEAPVPPAVNREGRFSKTDFEWDWDQGTVTCPQGEVRPIRPGDPEQPEKTVVIHFPQGTCTQCPLRAQCVGGNGGRPLSLDADEPVRQAERERQAGQAWQAHYRERSRVEHVIQRVTRQGGRRTHYWGRSKVEWQLQIVSAIQNIEELNRILRRRELPT
ncbi:MAG: IS1182 family transposase [Thermaerobacter sp.]|nr:IS1182 family transposase [Thermaerobacter sp.]